MSGGDPLFIVEVLGRAWGSLLLRPYVFGFLAVYLLAATAAWGWRRAAAFTVWAGSLAFAAEWSSTRVGMPFGLYHYTGVTAGRELYVSRMRASVWRGCCSACRATASGPGPSRPRAARGSRWRGWRGS